jgi:ectoine hydroxylase-related dioxygenase (phytanoyl-CoA dioxygenase family)
MTDLSKFRAIYERDGHVTVPGIFSERQMDEAVADAMAWADDTIAGLDESERQWYVDGNVKVASVLRKLDDPVFHRPVFQALAASAELTDAVEAFIGPGLSVAFSQIFFKPPEGGGPKPVHQDNFYFGCNDDDGMITAWIALDEATVENGCMHFANGSNKGPIIRHIAPEGEPFNLLIPDNDAAKFDMTPAPVPKGGVSFHHGNTLHQSSSNTSSNWRRAAAFHYVNRNTVFTHPALEYDDAKMVRLG